MGTAPTGPQTSGRRPPPRTIICSTCGASLGLGRLTPQPLWLGPVPIGLCLGGTVNYRELVAFCGTLRSPRAWTGLRLWDPAGWGAWVYVQPVVPDACSWGDLKAAVLFLWPQTCAPAGDRSPSGCFPPFSRYRVLGGCARWEPSPREGMYAEMGAHSPQGPSKSPARPSRKPSAL